MSKTIALVDDDRNILTGISIALERRGLKFKHIDGESALNGLTKDYKTDLAVDVKMPKMDGEELLKRIRKKCLYQLFFNIKR